MNLTAIESAVRRFAQEIRQTTGAEIQEAVAKIFGAAKRTRRPGRPARNGVSAHSNGASEAPAAAPAPRARRRTSAKQRAANKLQGAYLGTTRLLTAAQKKRVKALRGRKGVVAAIALAKKLRARA